MYDFDRDYKDIGNAEFITKSFFVRNCLPNAKSDMLLSAWNAPPDLERYDFLIKFSNMQFIYLFLKQKRNATCGRTARCSQRGKFLARTVRGRHLLFLN